jgi:hypothetical protein
MTKTTLARRAILIPLLAVALIVGGVALSLFQPWKLFVDETVDEAAPVAAAAPTESTEPTEPTEPAEPTLVSSGAFISHEHTTTGAVQILELPDGSRVLRIEDLDTSNGPDLKVWLTDAPVIEGRAGWGVFDDGAWVDLGPLKGNQGSQNYRIPDDVDLTAFSSVSIWCDRFNVSFGAAELVASA